MFFVENMEALQTAHLETDWDIQGFQCLLQNILSIPLHISKKYRDNHELSYEGKNSFLNHWQLKLT